MKKITTFLFFAICLINLKLFAQSFQEVSFPDITDTPSASRSANFVDVNGDGWDDIFFTNGATPGSNNMLYINNTDGTFTTISSGDIVNDNSRSVGATFADVDNDGDIDMLMVTFGFMGARPNFFYRNSGNAVFNHEPNTIMVNTYSETATWLDINNDQLLDAFITNSVGSLTNLYFENQGDGSFQSVTNLSITNENLPSRSVDWVDYDNDGDSDLFITNESNSFNSLFRNDGANNFTQINNLSFLQDLKSSAGSSWADIDNDGDFDLFVANYDNQSNQLFINNNGVFVEQTSSEIVSGTSNSFGSTFGDVDNDGDLDLFVCNAYNVFQNTNFLYLNDGNGNFTKDLTSDLANHEGWTFGAAFGDYDRDGWLDIILANNLNDNQTNSVYRNTGSGNNWVQIRCKGTNSNFSAIGAVIRVTTIINGDSVIQTRKIEATSGYCSQNSLTAHFGLGDGALIESVEVKWPTGLIENFEDLAVNTFYTIEEGNGILGTEDMNKFKVKVYPNPSKDYININLGNEISGKIAFELYSIKGNLMMRLDNISENYIDISVKSLEDGIYIYKLINNSKISTGKLIVNR